MQIKESNNVFSKTIEETEALEERESGFQTIGVFENEFFGNIMTLDGIPSIASKRSYRYFETAAQSAVCTHPNATKVLIIGGGNGGVATEVLKHKEIECVDIVEIDSEVIELSKKYFPEIAAAFDETRANLIAKEGYEFVRDAADKSYDIILIDALDALGNAVSFDKVFFAHANRILNDDGILICRAEDMDMEIEAYINRMETVAEFFRFALPFTAPDLLSVSGKISLIYASKRYHPTADLLLQRIDMVEGLKYYNADRHNGNFAMGTDTFQELLGSMKI